MPRQPGRGYLYVLVFTAGFATLGVELSASRLLDPWFGNSLIVWASLIGLILLYLAAGYWLGGRIADRFPQWHTLLRLSGFAAFAVGLVPALSRPVLQLASEGIDRFDAAVLAGSMGAVLLLFAVPVTLLGCVSPFAIRLAIHDVRESGAVAGRISAISTAGSILGSFLPVLLLIPTAGTRRTFALLSLALLLVVAVGLLRLGRPKELIPALLGAGLVAWLGFRPAPIKPAAGLIYETESAFNYIQVLDFGIERQLRLNEGEGIHSVYRPAGGRADGIWDYFLLAPAFNLAPYGPERLKRVAIVGLAAGTMAHLFTEGYGPIAIEGAELDPKIIQVGREYFGMNLPNLRAFAMDGRYFLSSGARQGGAMPYDLIAVDAYRPPYIPFHLITVEFFALAAERLSDDGVVAVNVGRTATDDSLVNAVAATMQAVFPSVYIVDEPTEGSPLGNTMVVGTHALTTPSDFHQNAARYNSPLLSEIATEVGPQVRVGSPPPDTPIFTDDRAPVEQVVHTLVIKYMLGLD